MSVFSIYVEKKPPYAVEAKAVLADLRTALGMEGIASLRIIQRYFVQNMTQEDFDSARDTIFSEPQVDVVYDQLPEGGSQPGSHLFAVEYLPGQFDQRADSCAQCIALSTAKEPPLVRSARVFLLEGELSADQLEAVKAYLINPVESREASLETPTTLEADYPEPSAEPMLTGFIDMDTPALEAFLAQYGLAMDFEDLAFCQRYFRDEEHRDPCLTEIRMIDTYWSDHCRHTTFLTHIDSVTIEHPAAAKTFERYTQLRETLYAGKDKPMTLMDMAVIGAKALSAQGLLSQLDESEEINACTVKIQVDQDGVPTEWLLLFKNETHNHPTEIEPFGGAATCLGGAIRDPLSGRSYVYQAMRVTGAGNPWEPTAQTRPGKLPQRKIVQTAAAGYSAYGNQVGLATGHVHELYHPGYQAKRMEIGAVIGAAPRANVVRLVPEPGDVVILLGGRTGRDGCGGATGSSKSHTADSLESCGAEVQKGNPPEERKIQRLFRNPEATRLIKRCNDFGAGGVSVAIGELADGLIIDLDSVPKKYAGLSGTELAISESQERMAVVVSPEDARAFIKLARWENLEATLVATVTEEPRLVMNWKGQEIVNLARSFLNSNGADKHASVVIPAMENKQESGLAADPADMTGFFSNPRLCTQKGLVQRFDSTIGAGTLLMPFGGKYQTTPAQAMAAKLPVLGAETTAASVMAWGFDPYLSRQNPYLGAMLAVIESVAKVLAAGGSLSQCWLTFQEYFGRTKGDPLRWGAPLAALLGALEAQLQLKIAAIGGKDSMSGSFEELDVPHTLVSFAASVTQTDRVISPEFKQAESSVYCLTPRMLADGTPDFEDLLELFALVEKLIAQKKIRAAWALGPGGLAEGVAKMSLGNRIGFEASRPIPTKPAYGGFILEAAELPGLESCLVGHTISRPVLTNMPWEMEIEAIEHLLSGSHAKVFPTRTGDSKEKVPTFTHTAEKWKGPKIGVASPRVLIPVFPGTNCEYDTAEAFRRAGANPHIFVVRSLTPHTTQKSVEAFVREIRRSNIIAIPGGFSGGDEPDGSGKFITAFFRNPSITEAVTALLQQRDGLMCGICNGFQALIKLGLVSYGEIRDMDEDCPTLTFNTIGRHQSGLVQTRVASNKSPWLMHTRPGEEYTVPISHGEGRFVASPEMLEQLAQNGQIATQYVDFEGQPTMDIDFNPNQSIGAVEGITSPDGRIFGKMGHTERWGQGLYVNFPHEAMPIFRGAVDYFSF
ncbi:phosphoribosylformylglycinamidine synthase [Oscillospiraceae bacterium MB08-C2-2]|nr:phosphoribosylformylglycinamidine synthase [Oscillospiraceae bacterium MB08-C2-2]